MASTHQTKHELIYCLQKRALRISCVYQRHYSQPLFLKLAVLSVYQVNHLQISLFVHSFWKRTPPSSYYGMFVMINFILIPHIALVSLEPLIPELPNCSFSVFLVCLFGWVFLYTQ